MTSSPLPRVMLTPGMEPFAAAVDEERQRQLLKFGKQRHPDGTGEAFTRVLARVTRESCQEAAAAGSLTWQLILLEEVFEALAEADEGRLLTELDQVAAVCAAWRWDLTQRRVERAGDVHAQQPAYVVDGQLQEGYAADRRASLPRATGVLSPCKLRVRRQPHAAHDWTTPEGAAWRCRGVVAATPVPDDVLEPAKPEEAPHRYLSTACLHGEHAYCQGDTGAAGAKRPAACKFCDAPCVCPCHPAGGYRVTWYEGVGEHGYEPARVEAHHTLLGALGSVAQQVGERRLLGALDGIQSTIAWLTDDLGFTVTRVSDEEQAADAEVTSE